MQQQDIQSRIAANPKFMELVKMRSGYGTIMTILMIMVYFGYILLIAFNKEFLATKISAGATMSIGIPMGLGVIVFTIAITWIYVRRANSEFDALNEEIIREAKKQ